MATPPNSPSGRRADTKLPQGVEAIPTDVPKEEWMAWPRKSEAGLIHGVPERRITQNCRTGKLSQYWCPDGTIRIDPGELTEVFGPQGSAEAAGRMGTTGKPGQKKNEELGIDVDDPYPALLVQLGQLIRDARDDNRKILDMVLNPANQHVQNLLEANERQTRRIVELENRWQLDQERRGAELEQLRAFELERQRAENTERRRNQIMVMLQNQVPALVGKFTGGPSIADFLADLDQESIDLMLKTDFLKPHQKAQVEAAWKHVQTMRAAVTARAARAQEEPSAPSAPTNGAPSA